MLTAFRRYIVVPSILKNVHQIDLPAVKQQKICNIRKNGRIGKYMPERISLRRLESPTKNGLKRRLNSIPKKTVNLANSSSGPMAHSLMGLPRN